MYCDDSRVTPVEAKEVVVSLPYHRLSHQAHPAHPTRVNPLTSYTIRESKSKLYVHISSHIPIFVPCFIAQSLSPCCALSFTIIYRLCITTQKLTMDMCINNLSSLLRTV